MLKIKDNVDLKKLEEFGFGKGFCRGKENYNYYQWKHLFVTDNDRIIGLVDRIQGDAPYIYSLTKLFDLIQAGLVEKVEVGNAENTSR